MSIFDTFNNLLSPKNRNEVQLEDKIADLISVDKEVLKQFDAIYSEKILSEVPNDILSRNSKQMVESQKK